jgi:hypothetical protein
MNLKSTSATEQFESLGGCVDGLGALQLLWLWLWQHTQDDQEQNLQPHAISWNNNRRE